MDIRIQPSKLYGTVSVPASKSIMHRALICAALADGTSVIQNTYISQDITATMNALRELGAEFSQTADTITVHGIKSSPRFVDLDCGESGSTIRFFIPIVAALCDSACFTGHGKLITRPLDLYRDAFSNKGTNFDYHGTLPATLSGRLQSGHYQILGNVSSQFITGLLFALPLLDGDSVIEVLPPFESKSYVDITLSCLSSFGVNVTYRDNCYYISGGQRYQATDYVVESDYSQAAFFLTANALGSDLALRSFDGVSVQGDCAILDIIKSMGARCHFDKHTLTTAFVTRKAFHIDASDIPDLVPTLCVMAGFCEGESTIRKVERLKIKESDRIASTMALVHELGGSIRYENDTLFIRGGLSAYHGGTVDCCNDHRIAMAGAMAATVATGDVILKGADCVRKSYPTFFEAFQTLGGQYHVINVD